jgi:hypothetical protein
MANNMAQQIIEQTVVSLARQMEQQVDQELQRLDNLGEDELDTIRQKRVLEMKQRQEKMKEWAARGHGEYREIYSEQEFFKEMKGEDRMICHFFRENWPCKVTGRGEGGLFGGTVRYAGKRQTANTVPVAASGHGQAFGHPGEKTHGDEVRQGRGLNKLGSQRRQTVRLPPSGPSLMAGRVDGLFFVLET